MTYAPAPDQNSPAKTAGYRISAFIRSYTKVIFVAMGMAVIGLVMKFAAMPSGNYVFVFAMAALALLFLVQVGFSFFYVISQVRLALLGSVCSVALVLGFTALIFRYQDWYGWQVTVFLALPMYLVTAFYLFRFFKKRPGLPQQHRTFLYQNLVVPYLFMLVLGIISVAASTRLFNKGPHHRLQDSPVERHEASDTSGMWRAY